MIKIYVANLAKYNEGTLKGKWINLPSYNLESEIAEILGNDEEIAIHDYEAPFEIGEYSNVFKLNEIAEEIDQLSNNEQEILKYILKTGEQGIVKALETLENGEYNIYEDCQTMADVAQEYIEQVGDLSSVVTNVDYYLDYKAFQRDLEINGYFDQLEEETGEGYTKREMENIAEELLEEASDKTKEQYFDYEAYGRDLEIEGNFYYVGNGVYVELH